MKVKIEYFISDYHQCMAVASTRKSDGAYETVCRTGASWEEAKTRALAVLKERLARVGEIPLGEEIEL